MSDFETLGLKAGIWSGLLKRAEAPARITLMHMGKPCGDARLSPAGEGRWRVDAEIPPASLSDGIQSYALLADDGQGEVPEVGAERLATFLLVAGKPLDMDLRAELDLLRAEMELLKREFRRMATG